MRSSRVVLAALLLLTAVPLQAAVLSRLSLPGGAPDLLLVIVVSMALAYGPGTGAVMGFAAGLVADLAPPSDHAAGRLALAYCIVGYFVGLLRDDAERSAFGPMVLVAVATAVAGLLYASVGGIIGDPRITWQALARVLPATVLYDVILAPFVIPAVVGLSRRLEPDLTRR